MLLLTGATGYLGSAVAAALSARGARFRCLGRRPLSGSEADLSFWDLGGNEAVSSNAFTDVSVAVHCAGLAHRMASEQDYDQVNVKASVMLAESAAEAGVQHFIYISSLNVISPLSVDPVVPPAALPELDEPYARSKRRAEIALWQSCERSGMALTVIRPALIYDQTLTANLATLERALRWWPFLLPDKGRRSLVGRPDVVQLILACADGRAGAPAGQSVVAATDGGCYSAKAVSRLLRADKSGPESGALMTPEWLCQWACRLLDWRRGLSQGSTWKALSTELWCGPAREVIGWQPRLTLKTRFGES